MQTFLPYANFVDSAKSLHYKHLGKQRLEAYQILRVLFGESKGYRSHPAVKMWANHEYYLVMYAIAMCDEWISRGYKDTLKNKIIALAHKYHIVNGTPPCWLGCADFHSSHKSNLLRKKWAYYSKFNWTEASDLPYVWPVK